jgi:hypothetical protein
MNVRARVFPYISGREPYVLLQGETGQAYVFCVGRAYLPKYRKHERLTNKTEHTVISLLAAIERSMIEASLFRGALLLPNANQRVSFRTAYSVAPHRVTV